MDFQLEQAIEILSRTPSVLRTLLDGLSDDWIRNTEGGETWSPYTVVGHLIHGEDADWIPRARVILEHGETRSFDPFDREAQFARYSTQPLSELLDLFAEKRRQSLEALREFDLTSEKLDLKGTHPTFGTVTMRQLLATWVVHDLGHIAQVSRVMVRQYADAVGPWKAFFSLLNT